MAVPLKPAVEQELVPRHGMAAGDPVGEGQEAKRGNDDGSGNERRSQPREAPPVTWCAWGERG